MRRFIVDAIVNHMLAGYGVTVMCGVPHRMIIVRDQVVESLKDLDMPIWHNSKFCVQLERGGSLALGQLQDFTGTSMEHTPFVVLQDIDKANQVLVPEARAIACRFADGKPPIVIEC